MKDEKRFLTDMVNHLETEHVPVFRKKGTKHALKGSCWWLFGCLGLVNGVCNFMDSMKYFGKEETIHCEIDMLNRRKAEVERNEENQ